MGTTKLSLEGTYKESDKTKIEGLLRIKGVVNVQVDINERMVAVEDNYNSKDGSEFVKALAGKRFKASVVKLTEK
ncbi:hypothetical protein SUGI_0242380 [Cryptomeria japonica]|nr:hypothetical protein SUGI_0242380 [Cryptomeria japonica]